MSCPTCQLIRGILLSRGVPGLVASTAGNALGYPIEEQVVKPVVKAIKKRTPTKYQKVYGHAYKQAAKKHPNYQHKRIVKMAHKAAKKKLK